MTATTSMSFADLGLNSALVSVLKNLGYEAPTPIQEQSIPILLSEQDLLGQAQTGTGKTAAFALPLINKINLGLRAPQVLVLAPTRELAIQVAEAFQSYARGFQGFHVLPIYGGQSMQLQLRQLKRGPHVIVGTPGRVIDHIKRGSLSLDDIKAVVLDEGDEMLKMGFIEDIEWILQKSPDKRQTALFSATMPAAIRRVASRYLKDPKEVKIHSKTSTVETIRQCYWIVNGLHKLDALTRILELEQTDAVLIFVRTKTATVELAEKLEARGHSCAALNGDLNQALRERTIDKVKKGEIDIVIATDVAARGLDVERISHVINYDIPYDTESYVHRIGRTGRAGRVGTAILFASMREQRMLKTIEKATRQKMELLKLPTKEDVYQHRIKRFADQVSDVLEKQDLAVYSDVVSRIMKDKNCEAPELLAALCFLAQKDAPFMPQESPSEAKSRTERRSQENNRETRTRDPRRGESRFERPEKRTRQPVDFDMETYRLEVGREHGVTPSNIVGTITRVAGLTGDQIGYIKLHDGYSTVQLPEGMPKDVFKTLARTEINGNALSLSLVEAVEANSFEEHQLRRASKGSNDRSPGRSGPERRRDKKFARAGKNDKSHKRSDRPAKRRRVNE